MNRGGVVCCQQAPPLLSSAQHRATEVVWDPYGQWRGERFSVYSAEEVAVNDGLEGRPLWVTHGDGVYDVGAVLAIHPGGQLLAQAGGSSLEEL